MRQRSAEWFSARTGKLTASRMADALAVLKHGGDSAARRDLKKQIIAERMTDIVAPHYVTPAMQWGIDCEEDARGKYQQLTGRHVAECGFIDHFDIDNFGASPDGLIGPDGLIEIKCPTTATFLDWLVCPGAPEAHHPQMLAQLACTGRAWVDFVAYDPRIKDPAKQLIVRRFAPAPGDIANIEDAARRFLAEVDTAFGLIMKAAA